MNWVERRFNQEEFLDEHRELMWRDLCEAIKASIESFKKLYKREARHEEKNGHQIKVMVSDAKSGKPLMVSLNLSGLEVEAVYTPSASAEIRKLVLHLNADAERPFRVNEEAVTTDQAAEEVLLRVFFRESVEVKVTAW